MAAQDDLFLQRASNNTAHLPLAERMRPKTLADMVGHPELTGDGGMLQKLLRAQKSISFIFYGPPGSGKTTLAFALAAAHNIELVVLSAVSAGIKDIRAAADKARGDMAYNGRPTWLFIDEMHRFNRGQQDALLPHVESGVLTLLGATTENPAYEINGALLSRCRVVRLKALDDAALTELLRGALEAQKRGHGAHRLTPDDGVLVAIARHSHGDARRAFGALEAAAAIAMGDGRRTITLSDARMGAQNRFLVHDKSHEAHHTLLSALIKSMRASDQLAAVYYLARLLEAGEAPRIPLRRMVIFASEDIGLADPQAMVLAVSTLQAFELMGLPEGTLPLTQLAMYLARAPKSRAVVGAYGRGQEAVRRHGALDVPPHLHPNEGHAQKLDDGRARHAGPPQGAKRSNLPAALAGFSCVDDG